jgi:RHS repeat-associated protein
MNKGIVTLILFVSAFAINNLFAQVGNDSPAGVAGELENSGIITTGCHYDAYTGNAKRSVTDIVVAGSVGAYPLAFTRTSNSCDNLEVDDGGDQVDFGSAGNWRHSYQWNLYCKGSDTNGNPNRCSLHYPDGAGVTFTPSTNGDPYWRGGKGIRDRLQVVLSRKTIVGAYLLMPDGGKVSFSVSGIVGSVQSIIDPYGRTTTISGDPANFYPNSTGLVTITEPGGRWLKLYYVQTGLGWFYVIDHLTASDGRTVQYGYTISGHTTSSLDPWLSQVTYYNDPTLVATYSYQPDHSGQGDAVLSTCIDPMYAGPMWKIAYTYSYGAYGQIQSENYFDGTNIGPAVSTLAYTGTKTRKETRADGKTRTFTYDASTPALLINWTDFKGNGASQTYDTNGYVNSVTDFNGHTTNFTNNMFTGGLLAEIFPATPGDTPPGTPRGGVLYTYGSAGCADPNNRDSNNPYYVCTTMDSGGHTTTYLRDTSKRVTQVNYPDGGNSESFQYNSFGQVTSHTMRAGGTETFTYDARGLPQTYRDPYHATGNPNIWYQYDSLDRVSGTTSTLGTGPGDINHTTNYTYNSRGDGSVMTLPVDPVDGQRHTITKGYNLANGTLTSVTDQLGHQTSLAYDDYKRLRITTTPPRFSGDTMNYASNVYYDANGAGDDYTRTDANPTWLVSPTGKKIENIYDENLRKVSMTVAFGASDAATTSFVYDLNGNLTSVVAPKEQPGQPLAGQNTTTAYDERDRPYLMTDPLGNPTSYTFDAAGHKKTVTRANTQLTTFDSFDAMNRVLQSTVKQTPDPDAVTKYTYYPSGLLHTMQDPHLVANGSSEAYTYQYDSMGRKTSLTYPRPTPSATPTSESWHYDTAGRIDTFTNRNGNTQQTLYDNLNRAYKVSWNDSELTPTVTFGYDAASRVTSINNANANISHAYFNDGLLNSETTTYADNTPRTVTYYYDADGNRAGDGTHAGIQYPSGAYSFNYAYTGRNQLSDVNNFPSGTNIAHFVYDLDGNLNTQTRDNSTTSSYTSDGLDRVTHIGHALTGTTRTFDYAYDSVSNRKWTKRDGGNGEVFGYDLADQSTSILLNVANPGTTSPGAQTINYDANGNRTTFSPYGSTDTYTTNNLNQYAQRNAASANYDTKGNMLAGFDGSTYTYDAQSRLLSATKPPAITPITISYDGLNRAVKRVNNRAIQAVSAVSRMIHGSAGTFDLALPLTGSPAIECRSQGGNFQIVVTFSPGVNFSGATVSTGTGSISSTSISSDHTQITINLTGVSNAQTIVVTLTGVTDGAVMNDVPVAMRVLSGDTNADGSVDGSDVSQTQSQVGQTVSTSNFREDVTVNGLISNSDVSLVQGQMRTTVGSYSQNPPTPGTIYSVYDGWNLIAEYEPGKTVPNAAYLGGIKNLTANLYYYQDGGKSTSHLADSTGHLLEWYRYDLQGTPFFFDPGNNQLTTSNYSVRHLFTGQQYYSELGLYDLRNRFYSPDIGRFLQSDPISFNGDQTNLYRYCGNNPTTCSDPTGELAYWTGNMGIGGTGSLQISIPVRYAASPGFASGFSQAIQSAYSGTATLTINNVTVTINVTTRVYTPASGQSNVIWQGSNFQLMFDGNLDSPGGVFVASRDQAVAAVGALLGLDPDNASLSDLVTQILKGSIPNTPLQLRLSQGLRIALTQAASSGKLGVVAQDAANREYYGAGYVGDYGYGGGFNGYGGLAGRPGPAFGLSGFQSDSYRTGYSSDGSYTAPGTSMAPPDSTIGSFGAGCPECGYRGPGGVP